ncbi:hypothetical protein [Microbacterium flavum]|uniref:PH domain-containing protein n=1 Tax=Microbacterium flavum TaxID=415216 RepID=A0ABS5XS21_9MICO|nr:hypothetical protein [Microbacterium flavum]MBT8797312.1 hypothetical protein [Microbacterium flavum]
MPADPRPSGATPERRVLRPTSGTVILIVSGVVVLGLLVDAAVRAGLLEMLRLAPWLLLVLWGVYIALYAPHIAYDRSGVFVQNYLRRTWIPWSRVADIAMRWQVQFALTGGGSVAAYGGPAASRPGRNDRRQRSADRPVPSWLRDLGDLRDTWQHADDAASGTGAPARSWDVPALIVLGVLVAAAAGSVISVQG